MPNPENLIGKGFKPGQSGNPKGKPKGTISAKTIIRKWLESEDKMIDPITKKEQKVTVMDVITLALITKARKGDAIAFNALLDRMDGKPKQEVGFTDNQGNDVLLGYGKEDD